MRPANASAEHNLTPRRQHEYLVTGAPTWLDAALMTVHIPALMFMVIPKHGAHFLMFVVFLVGFAVQWWWSVKRGQFILFGYSRFTDRRNNPKRYILSSAVNIAVVIPVVVLLIRHQAIETIQALVLALSIYVVLVLNAKFNTPWIVREDASAEAR
ncbi:hypothetical protein HF984_04375 [Rothia terrae]|uniref:hypothetical protein n=1 Tax=Rothia terrae TaxID=396015 RepID=UPI00144709A1|nr:hypothetical protein [Rothia terrae]MDT0189355.1 hypothetical protein [Rothia terrae]NKZ34008.1 hypothetical protein [Rothia terrae]